MINPYSSINLVNQYITKEKLNEVYYNSGPTLLCNKDTVIDCERIADGSFTPLKGFVKKAEMESIINNNFLLNGTFFPIPIYLQIPQHFMQNNVELLFLRNESTQEIFGYIKDVEIYSFDLEILSNNIFGTSDKRHPGVNKLFQGGEVFVGGEINILPQENSLKKYCFSPETTRQEIEKAGWSTCVGFQTRNVPHLAHEYLQKVALELFDGVLIHPVIGWKKADDYAPEVVMDAYSYLRDEVYPQNKVLLSGLEMQMRYAGPKEAIFHAIIRQNYGCSHFIVGRDHAGVGGFYETYAAHKLVDKVKEYLDIKILKMKGPFYCSKCKGIVTDNTCAHPEMYHSEISGTIIRDCIIKGEYPPSEFIRSEVVDSINKHKKIFVDIQVVRGCKNFCV